MKKKNILARNLLQFGILALIIGAFIRSLFFKAEVDFEKYCPFGGIQSLFTYFNNGNLACSMTAVNLVLGIALILGIVLFGKLFCSYICPLGTLSEFFGKFGKKWKVRIEIRGIADKLLRLLKYALLFITLYFTLQASELFCKQYDPFYATLTLFGHEVKYLFAIISISIFVLGSIFFRLFWCKYLCPLGAISNIFRYFVLVIGIVALYFILVSFGITIHIAYYIGLACLVGYLVEITNSPLQEIKMLKITRNEHICIDCGLCTRTCPQGIDVANEEKVTHPDCNMCGDCVEKCPENGALTINNIKIKWLPLIVVSVLVILAMIVGHKIEVPSTENYWATKDGNEKSFVLSGLDQMTCVSTAKDYSNRFKEIPGVEGAATYVRSRSAKITYNPDSTSEQTIRKSFFIPVRKYIKESESIHDTLIVYKLQLDNNIGLKAVEDIEALLHDKEIYQMETQFKDGVELLIFTNKATSDSSIVKGIASNKKSMYNVESIVKSPVTISGLNLNKRNFVSFKRFFNNASKVPREKIGKASFRLDKYPRNKSEFAFLINYLGKKYSSFIGLDVYYDSIPQADVYFIKDELDWDLFYKEMNVPIYEVEYTNGKREKIENLYQFSSLEQ